MSALLNKEEQDTISEQQRALAQQRSDYFEAHARGAGVFLSSRSSRKRDRRAKGTTPTPATAVIYRNPLPVSTTRGSMSYMNACLVRDTMKNFSKTADDGDDNSDADDDDDDDFNELSFNIYEEDDDDDDFDELELLAYRIEPLVERARRLGLRWKVDTTSNLLSHLKSKNVAGLPPGLSCQWLISQNLGRVVVVAIYGTRHRADRAGVLAHIHFDDGSFFDKTKPPAARSKCVSRGLGDDDDDQDAVAVPRLVYFLEFDPVVFQIQRLGQDADLSTPEARSSVEASVGELLQKAKSELRERINNDHNASAAVVAAASSASAASASVAPVERKV